MYAMFLLGVAVGVAFTWAYFWYEGHKIRQQIEQYAHNMLGELQDKLIPATIEIAENRLFMYNKDTKAYITDAATFDELNDKASEMYPGMFFDVDQDEIDRAQKFSDTVVNIKA